MIPSPIPACLILCSIPILLPKIDSTYFMFRNVTLIGPTYILICRILLIFFVTLHGSILIYDFIIHSANNVLLLHAYLRVIANNPKAIGGQTVLDKNNAANSNLGNLSRILVQKISSFSENTKRGNIFIEFIISIFIAA